MALPSLALGIGLQGQYDYKQQAALNLARDKGRAKAEADEAAARAKKLAPIERRLQRITGEGLLPVHAKAMKEKVMETIDYMQDHPEDLGGVTQRLYDIEATQGAFKAQGDLIKKTQTSSYLQGDADAVANIMSSDSPDAIEESLSINPSTGIRYDKASNNFVVAPTKYINSSTRIDNILQKGGSNYYMPTEEEKIIDVNGKKFASFNLNPNVADVVLSEMLTGDNLASANDDYYSYLKRNRTGLPNLRTPEGIAEFEAGRDKFLKDQIAGELTVRGLLRDVTPSKGATFNNYYAPGGKTGGVLTQQGSEQINFGEGEFIQTHPGVPTLNDQTITLPNNNTMYNLRTGKRVKTTDVIKATYNKPSLVTVASENYNFPATTFTGADGKKYTLPAKSFEKGQPIPLGYDKFVVKNGKGKAQYVIFGQGEDSKGNTLEIVRAQGDVGIGPFVDAAKYEQAQLDDIVQKGKEAQEKMQNEFNATAEKGRQEKAAAANKNPAATVKEKERKGIVPNVNAKDEAKQAAKDTEVKKKKTAEQQLKDIKASGL
jgi:hypothetical protein